MYADDPSNKLVHAKVSHTEGEAHRPHQVVLSCVHDPWHAESYRRGLFGRPSSPGQVEEEAFG